MVVVATAAVGTPGHQGSSRKLWASGRAAIALRRSATAVLLVDVSASILVAACVPFWVQTAGLVLHNHAVGCGAQDPQHGKHTKAPGFCTSGSWHCHIVSRGCADTSPLGLLSRLLACLQVATVVAAAALAAVATVVLAAMVAVVS